MDWIEEKFFWGSPPSSTSTIAQTGRCRRGSLTLEEATENSTPIGGTGDGVYPFNINISAGDGT